MENTMQKKTQSLPKQRIVCLDVIRVFSCICILFVHFNATVSRMFVCPNGVIPSYYLGGRVYLGDIGVSLFFMLAGVTQMLTYRPGNVTGYYKKRFVALYPMFWIALFAASAYDFLLYKGLPGGNLWSLLCSVMGMDGYMNALRLPGYEFYKVGEWFLGCIVLIYAVFPLLHAGVKKAPALTFAAALLLYIFFEIHPTFGAYTSRRLEFFLRVPEVLFGMFFAKYRLWEGRKRWGVLLISCGVLLAGWLARDVISNTTLAICLCLALFSLLTLLSSLVRSQAVIELLGKAAVLTYPIFLVHHWLIEKLFAGFDPAALPRRTGWFLFLIYLALTALLSLLLQKAEKVLPIKRFSASKASAAVTWAMLAAAVALPVIMLIRFAAGA